MQDDDFDIVQVGDAAAMLHMTPSGVRWLIDVGKLPPLRTPSGQRILRREDVEEYAVRRDAVMHERRSAYASWRL